MLYVEALVGRDTVNTMPEATLGAFRDHGVVRPGAVTADTEAAAAVLAVLPRHGIDLAEVADALLDEGLAAFTADLTGLLRDLEDRLHEIRRVAPGSPLRRLTTAAGWPSWNRS